MSLNHPWAANCLTSNYRDRVVHYYSVFPPNICVQYIYNSMFSSSEQHEPTTPTFIRLPATSTKTVTTSRRNLFVPSQSIFSPTVQYTQCTNFSSLSPFLRSRKTLSQKTRYILRAVFWTRIYKRQIGSPERHQIQPTIFKSFVIMRR